MHRVFDQKPQLAQSFLTVDPEQVTDVFAVTETTDKIYGQIWLDITCKLPIARVAIPRLDQFVLQRTRVLYACALLSEW